MESSALELELLSLLRRLTPREKCILQYDFDFIDTLPDILLEQYGILPAASATTQPDVTRLLALLRDQMGKEVRNVQALPSAIRSTGLNLEEFKSQVPEGLTGEGERLFDNWSRSVLNDSVGEVLALQKDLGMGQWTRSARRYTPQRGDTELKWYLRSVTTAPPTLLERVTRKHFWELRFALWKFASRLDPTRRSLSVGPRWLTEIDYFREVVALRNHIGLDLFSDDPSRVIAGDMHDMPFESGHFHFVFIKNTVDKSYDVRELVRELLRVVEPGGLIVVDQICGYGRCSPINRTDIQYAANLLRLFQARAVVSTLVCKDVDVSGLGDAKEKNETRRNARLAFQVSGRRS